MTYGETTYGGAAYGSTQVSDVGTLGEQNVVWRVVRDGTFRVPRVYDVEVEDTANPFGDFAVVKLDDNEGTQFDNFQRGTRVDVDFSTNGGQSYTTRFTGFVVERRETDEQGADALEVEAYSFDQFLRNNTVSNDQSGKEIATALEDIIKTDTPVMWDASNVSVGDEQELTRSYRGEPVEEVLRDLAFKSDSEDFGVNDSLEFFFQPPETEHIDRGISDTQWFNYDIPELGKEVRNEVEVWFDDGEESVIVADGQDKQDLQDNLNLSDPGTQRAEINRPDITDIADAEDEGRKYLRFNNSTLSGTVTTFELFDAEPGDTIDVTISERGIDTEFRIAAINYQWGRDETRLTIVEKRGDQDDILFEISGTVDRLEMQDANRDAQSNRITTTEAIAQVDVSIDADGNTPDGNRFVNDARNAVAAGWRGNGNLDISEIIVGNDNSGLSRSNTDLRNQTNSASASESLSGSTAVDYSATITQTDVQEVGLKTSTGTLVARAIFDSAVNLSGTVTITLSVADDSRERSVWTNTGQESVRDILAENNPTLPQKYAYGSGTTDPTESDTSLETQETTQDFDTVLIDSLDTQSQWDNSISDFADDEPLKIENGDVEQKLSTWYSEAEDATWTADPDINPVDDTDIRSGNILSDEGIRLNAEGHYVERQFIPNYDIPVDELGAGTCSLTTNFDGTVAVRVNGKIVNEFTFSGADIDNGSAFTLSSQANRNEFAAGEQNVVRWEITDLNSGSVVVDVVWPFDTGNRFGGFDKNDNPSQNSTTGRWNGPENYADVREVSFDTAKTQRDVTEATADQTWDNTNNDQFIELSNDGSTFIRSNNTSTASATFSSPEPNVDVRVGISRWGSDIIELPTEGFNTQTVSTHDLTANPDALVSDGIGLTFARAVIQPGTITGVTVSEAGILDGSDDLLTRHTFAGETIASGERLISAESDQITGTE